LRDGLVTTPEANKSRAFLRFCSVLGVCWLAVLCGMVIIDYQHGDLRQLADRKDERA